MRQNKEELLKYLDKVITLEYIIDSYNASKKEFLGSPVYQKNRDNPIHVIYRHFLKQLTNNLRDPSVKTKSYKNAAKQLHNIYFRRFAKISGQRYAFPSDDFPLTAERLMRYLPLSTRERKYNILYKLVPVLTVIAYLFIRFIMFPLKNITTSELVFQAMACGFMYIVPKISILLYMEKKLERISALKIDLIFSWYIHDIRVIDEAEEEDLEVVENYIEDKIDTVRSYLFELYDQNIISPAYRNYFTVMALYDEIISGNCTALETNEDGYGAYALYDQKYYNIEPDKELERARTNLDEYAEKMPTLYESLQKTNALIESYISNQDFFQSIPAFQEFEAWADSTLT